MMDTSKQYIRMCEKAEEIQKEKPDEAENSYFYCNLHKIILANDDGVYYCQRCLNDGEDIEAIWLPRQDQLQEMLWENNKINHVPFMIDTFNLWYSQNGAELALMNNFSMEQLWLAFVMKERYGKVWRNNEWVKEDINEDY